MAIGIKSLMINNEESTFLHSFLKLLMYIQFVEKKSLVSFFWEGTDEKLTAVKCWSFGYQFRYQDS